MNRTVKYQGAFSRIVGFAGKRFLFSTPPPSTFFCSRSNFFRAITRLETLATQAKLSFIGYKGFGNFLRNFQLLIFSHFLSKKCPLKANTSQKKNIQFKTKQIMPMNQAYDRLYSDKVSKFAIFGPISNFARSLQATPLKRKDPGVVPIHGRVYRKLRV